MSNAAGLPSRAHVGMMRRGELVNVRTDTLARVARTADVSLHWLATGDGRPDDRDTGPDIRVDRHDPDHVDAPPPSSRASAVSRALWDVARVLPGVTPEDYDAARAVASDSAQFMDHDGDVAGFAESLLRAAASLRRDGIPASTAAVLTRVAVGRVHGAEARDAVPAEAVVEHLEERARASGLEPGEKREHGKRIGEEIARKRGRTLGN